MKQASLRAWLRREPAPDKVKVRLEDGEERNIVIPGDIRNRWKTVEASVLASGGVEVLLLDKKGDVLRAQPIEHDEREEEDEADPVVQADNARSRQMKEWTGMLQAVMHEQNCSFEKGKDAASQSQEHLVNLVDTLAAHFATALTNIHNIVANTVQMQQSHAEQMAKLTSKLASLERDGDERNPMVEAAIGAIAARAMAGPIGVVPPTGAAGKGGK